MSLRLTLPLLLTPKRDEANSGTLLASRAPLLREIFPRPRYLTPFHYQSAISLS